jgi:hypothetical protein
MSAPQRTRLRSRWCLAGLLAAVCVAFSPPLKAAVTLETFTNYNAFLSLLGSQAQVVTFDDVPTSNGFGFFDPNRYANQGLVFSLANPTVLNSPDAVSAPNVYENSFPTGLPTLLGPFRSQSAVSFTSGGQPAATSAFGTFFIGNEPVDGQDTSGLAVGGDYNYIPAGLTSRDGSSFLGVATVDSSTGQLVPAINQIWIAAGAQDLQDVYLDNFTFATPEEVTPVSPVPEANAGALLAVTTLAAVALYRRRVATAA